MKKGKWFLVGRDTDNDKGYSIGYKTVMKWEEDHWIALERYFLPSDFTHLFGLELKPGQSVLARLEVKKK